MNNEFIYKLNENGEAIAAYIKPATKLTASEFRKACESGNIGDAEKVRLYVADVMGCGDEGGAMVLEYYPIGDIKTIALLLTKYSYEPVAMDRARQMIFIALQPLVDLIAEKSKQAIKEYNRNRK